MNRSTCIALALASIAGGAFHAERARAQSNEPAKVTKEDLQRWSKELSNWGRRGQDDQLGALNLVTPQKRKEAAALVREGVSVSLSRDLETEKSEYNPKPLVLTMIVPGGPDKAEVLLDTIELS